MNNPTLPPDFTLHIHYDLEIDAPASVVFDAILDQAGPGSTRPDGQPMPLMLEPWPGGRWFRDTGNNTGHFWGHVQVIKPPKVLELCGPMFMSYPVASHVQYLLTETAGKTSLSFTHRAMGTIADEHRAGVNAGWKWILEQVKAKAASKTM